MRTRKWINQEAKNLAWAVPGIIYSDRAIEQIEDVLIKVANRMVEICARIPNGWRSNIRARLVKK